MNTVKVEDRVESETQRNYWGFCTVENDETLDSFKDVGDMTDEELASVAKRFGTTPEFMSEINSYLASLRESIHNDLSQIWELLEK